MCKLFVMLGLITQFMHNIFDLIGLQHYFHDQVELELVLTLSVFLSIWDYFKPIVVMDKYKRFFQIFLTIGTFSNLLVAIVLVFAELFEMLEEEIHFLHGLILFLLINSIYSLIYMTLKYKREFSIEWKDFFRYEAIFILIAFVMNFLIEPIFHLIDSIGYDVLLYISIPIVLFIWKYKQIAHYWKTQKILVISVSSVFLLLIWQLGLLGF